MEETTIWVKIFTQYPVKNQVLEREKLTDEADQERFVVDEARFVAKVTAKGK